MAAVRAVDIGDVHQGLTEGQRLVPAGTDCRFNQRFRTAQVRQVVDILSKLSHDPPRQPIFCAARVKGVAWFEGPAPPKHPFARFEPDYEQVHPPAEVLGVHRGSVSHGCPVC
jgi:hypothetical protein